MKQDINKPVLISHLYDHWYANNVNPHTLAYTRLAPYFLKSPSLASQLPQNNGLQAVRPNIDASSQSEPFGFSTLSSQRGKHCRFTNTDAEERLVPEAFIIPISMPEEGNLKLEIKRFEFKRRLLVGGWGNLRVYEIPPNGYMPKKARILDVIRVAILSEVIGENGEYLNEGRNVIHGLDSASIRIKETCIALLGDMPHVIFEHLPNRGNNLALREEWSFVHHSKLHHLIKIPKFHYKDEDPVQLHNAERMTVMNYIDGNFPALEKPSLLCDVNDIECGMKAVGQD